MASGNHKNSRFVPYISEWQISRKYLDGQHRKREDIGLLRTSRLPLSLLAWWVYELGGQPSRYAHNPGRRCDHKRMVGLYGH